MRRVSGMDAAFSTSRTPRSRCTSWGYSSLDHPRWIAGADFDLDRRVHRVAAPEPRDLRALAQLAGEVASDPLRRDRPLWEMWIVEGLRDGQVGMITKMHHAAIDGTSGNDLMVHMFDLEPEPSAPPDPPASEVLPSESPPSDLHLLLGAVRTQVGSSFRLVRTAAQTLGKMAGVARGAVRRGNGTPSLPRPFRAPRVSFSKALTSHRSPAFAQIDLAEVRSVKDAAGGKVNDVLLAITSVALRRWLDRRGELPRIPLLASCPVSMHDEGHDGVTNMLSTMLVELPVQLEDPVAHLERIIAETKGAKEFVRAIGAETLMDWADLTAPRLLNLASRMYASLRLGDLHPPLHDLIVSNVPGPPVPLYVAGAEVRAIYPLGPLLPGAGLNITFLSNRDSIDVGLLACTELVPDLWELASSLEEAMGDLHAALVGTGG